MGSTLSAGRAQCKPADRFDRYRALRQVKTIAGPGARRDNDPARFDGRPPIAWRRLSPSRPGAPQEPHKGPDAPDNASPGLASAPRMGIVNARREVR
jgi:hypothetical protein